MRKKNFLFRRAGNAQECFALSIAVSQLRCDDDLQMCASVFVGMFKLGEVHF